ncbi:MAG: DUF2911 domain-containing protein [Calditrichia bacterium]
MWIPRFQLLTAVIVSFLALQNSTAQPQLTLPQVSPAAEIRQTIGLTEIIISYHRPAVNGREIWGNLVPYGQVWRAGANENTTISFSDTVMINGKELPAGKYGLHMLPEKDKWTIIFSNVHWAWGSFSYDSTEDALRISATPETAPFEERLNYRFDGVTGNSAEIALYWEKLRVPFTVTIDEHKLAIQNFRRQLRDLPRFFWRGWYQAANYANQNNIATQQALDWIDRSININENFSNLQVKADLLKKMGRRDEAARIQKRAFELATENEVNQYGYQLLSAGNVNEAIEIFRKNIADHPDSWNVYDSMGEAYAVQGDTVKAVEFYKKALDRTADQNQQQRIRNILQNLQKQGN